MHLKRLIRCVVNKVQREDQREYKLREIVKDISLETLWKCWRTYHYALLASLWGLKGMLVVPLHLRLSPKTLIKCRWRWYLWMITSYVHALILPMFRVIGSCIMTCMFLLQVFFCTCFCWSYFSCPIFECVQKFKNP